MYNFGMHEVLRAFLQVIEDSQFNNGDLPAAVPEVGLDHALDGNGSTAGTRPCGDIAWGAAFPVRKETRLFLAPGFSFVSKETILWQDKLRTNTRITILRIA